MRSGNFVQLGIVALLEWGTQWTHLVSDLLHWIGRRGRQSSGGIVSQFLTLSIVAGFLKLHLKIVEEAVVGWTLRGRAAEREAAGRDVIFNELAVVRRLSCKLYCTVFE